MIQLTPGVRFTAQIFGTVFTPLLVAHFILTLASSRYFSIAISPWLHFLLCALALPVWVYARSWWSYLREEREIAALGAVRVPAVQASWPGNLDVVFARLKDGKEGYPADAMQSLTLKYGKIVNMRILGKDRIITSDPEHMKCILATNVYNWEKGPYFRNMASSVLGSGVFNADGEMWQFHRSTTRPFFSRERVTDFEIYERHTNEAIQVIASHVERAFDFQELVRRFTLDVVMDFLLGARVHSLRELQLQSGIETGSPEDSELRTFDLAFFTLQHHLAQRSRRVPIWPLFEVKQDITSKDMHIVRKFLQPLIANAIERKQARVVQSKVPQWVESEEKGTLLDHLVSETDAYALAIHPSVVTRLRGEILREVGSRPLTVDDIPKLKYLRAVLNETLRLFPPVPGNARVPIKSCTLPPIKPGAEPFYIPAGTNVPFSIMYMHRSKDLWGDDAEEFDPERWIDDRLKKYYLANPFIFLPFNAGPRICLGQQFVLHEAAFFTATVLQKFESIQLAEDAMPPEARPPAVWKKGPGRKAIEKIKPKSDLTLSVEGGLWLRFKKAEHVEIS